MQWWNSFVDWFYSDEGQRLLVTAIIPFIAIVLAGIIAALIGRGATKRLVTQRDHETRAAAVSALISAGQNAARWHSQSPAAREHAEHLANDADILVRLLPISGASYAADWASHQLADMRTNSVSYSYQAEQTLGEYRERLVLWLHRPSKGRKLFAADLERWRYEDQAADPLITEQQKWAEQQYTAATDEPVDHAAEVPLPAETVAIEPVTTQDRYSAPVATTPPATASTSDGETVDTPARGI